ncbi:hypothetical protein GCK72_010379 [Caenorhabditis remanei]|uniref:AD domain-containing protein n=1 Tax=Caenorhabditis remanei TaxID=31234 RepID=E3LYF8_CAERE|nr:hypothetical protein GCK72_010379 [Caenorhabditis remanei]EFO86777.1 hypothetical protein CRE_04639 [Caenorhabditis remanei]KAF1762117.1 hypothetical protein GCK72_010379 [Caenorhabditis remanei]
MVSCNLTAPEVQVGATIKIETNNGLIAEGIVISLDALRKVLVLDTKETTGSKPVVRIFNSEHLNSITVVTAALEEGQKHAINRCEQFRANNPVNGAKTAERLQKTLGDLRPNLMKSSNVSIKGQQAYIQLKRTIAETYWSGEDIRVLGLVLVQKPYDVDNVTKDAKATGFDETRANNALLQVKKILSKPATGYTSRAPLDFTIGAVVTN